MYVCLSAVEVHDAITWNAPIQQWYFNSNHLLMFVGKQQGKSKWEQNGNGMETESVQPAENA